MRQLVLFWSSNFFQAVFLYVQLVNICIFTSLRKVTNNSIILFKCAITVTDSISRISIYSRFEHWKYRLDDKNTYNNVRTLDTTIRI